MGRLVAMVRKEGLQILRDPSSLAIAFVMPLVLLLLFGYGVSLDAREVPVAIVVEQPGPEADRFSAGLEHSEYFRSEHFSTIQEAERALRQRRVDGIVWLRADFSDRLLSGRDAPISGIVDGVNANQARVLEGYCKACGGAGWSATRRAGALSLQPAGRAWNIGCGSIQRW